MIRRFEKNIDDLKFQVELGITETISANNREISYIGRKPAASPATGYAKRHLFQQKEILKEVFLGL